MGYQLRALNQQSNRPNTLGLSDFVPANRTVSEASVFGDAHWDMSSLVTLPGVKGYQKYWNFASVPGFPCGFSLSLAEYAYARLYAPLVAHDREASWLTVHCCLSALRNFSQFCESRGLSDFNQVDKYTYEEYLKVIRFGMEDVAPKSDERVRYIAKTIYKFWDYRARVSNGLQHLPFGGSFDRVFKRSRSRSSFENATPVIPEEVYAPLMQGALSYVLAHSTTILNAWAGLDSEWKHEVLPRKLTIAGGQKRLDVFARRHLQDHPAIWRVCNWVTVGDIYCELQMLRTACLLVVLAFSGIRISELLDLEAGCYVSDKCSDGRERYYINTRIHKHREKGSRDTWVVIDEVVKAIQVLERLTEPHRYQANTELLFTTDHSAHFFTVFRRFDGASVRALTSGAILRQIEVFRLHVNSRLNCAPIPDWTNEEGVTLPWHFNTRQFRRTLARYISRQPFGVIAGMIQYKHVAVATFQGYAGLEPEWNKLLEEERVLASIDILDELALDLSNGQVAGRYGQRLKAEFAEEFRGRAEDYPPSQIAKWLASNKKSLFVGKFNFCFYESERALCTKGQTTNTPILNFCQPERCSNACVGKRHIVQWKAQLKQAEEFLAHPKASPIQRDLMAVEVKNLRNVVQEFGI
jgi:hypothetical protein